MTIAQEGGETKIYAYILVQFSWRREYISKCGILKNIFFIQTIEKQLQTQALILESLDHTLFQTQMELKKEVSIGWCMDGNWEARNHSVLKYALF